MRKGNYTVKENLFKIIKNWDGWISGGVLERMEIKNSDGTLSKPSTIGREARDLPTLYPDRIIKREVGKKGSVEYKYVKSDYERIHEQLR